jgi:hypothetical protein
MDTSQMKEMLGDPTWREDTLHKWTYDMGMGVGILGTKFHELVLTYTGSKVTIVEHQEIHD